MANVDYIQVTDLEQKIKDLNLNQFKNSENINKLLSIFAALNLEEQQEWVALAEERILINAVGEQLDEIGRQLSLPRYSSTDGEYRTRLLLASKRRSADITRDEIVELIAIASGDEDPNVYLGEKHRVDVTVLAACISGEEGARELERYFPINTSLKVVGIAGMYFGFGTNSNNSNPDAINENGRYIEYDDKALGFGTTAERDTAVDAGRISSLVYTNRR